jgi:phytoene dehydrogenase-like protein
MGKYNEISLREFAARFQSPVLRTAFENFWSPDMSMTFFLLQYSFAQKGMAGYPLGGSGKFIEKLLNRYLDLKGKLMYHQKITEILIENDKATGLKTNEGQVYIADYTVSACDGHTVLFQMLQGKYVDEKTRTAYQTLQTFPSLLYFSAGINRTFPEVEPSIIGLNIPFETPVQIGKYTHPRASFQIYNFDPTVAPPGRTLVTAMLETDYEYWQDLYDLGLEIYQAEKEKIAQAILQNLEKQLGNILDKVDFVDTATPVTYKNWTGNHHGSYEGWLPTPAASKVKFPSHFHGLANFYMAGHWVVPGGGMPPAAYSGRDAIQLICQQERQHFHTY